MQPSLVYFDCLCICTVTSLLHGSWSVLPCWQKPQILNLGVDVDSSAAFGCDPSHLEASTLQLRASNGTSNENRGFKGECELEVRVLVLDTPRIPLLVLLHFYATLSGTGGPLPLLSSLLLTALGK